MAHTQQKLTQVPPRAADLKLVLAVLISEITRVHIICFLKSITEMGRGKSFNTFKIHDNISCF